MAAKLSLENTVVKIKSMLHLLGCGLGASPFQATTSELDQNTKGGEDHAKRSTQIQGTVGARGEGCSRGGEEG